jgi:hypothetical protein
MSLPGGSIGDNRQLKERSLVSSLSMPDIPDIQSLPDERQIPIDKVGVKGLRYPFVSRTEARGCNTPSASSIFT